MTKLDLSPAQVDLDGIRAGDLNQFQLTVKRAGKPMDITDLTFTAQARTTPLDATALDAVISVVDAENGVLSIRWPGTEVTDWLGSTASKTGFWDLQMAEVDSDPVTICSGGFTAEMDVTR